MILWSGDLVQKWASLIGLNANEKKSKKTQFEFKIII